MPKFKPRGKGVIKIDPASMPGGVDDIEVPKLPAAVVIDFVKETITIVEEHFWLKLGDRVIHIGEPGAGTVVSIDIDCYLLERYGVTTCQVLWDDSPDGATDTQWTNKLEKIEAI